METDLFCLPSTSDGRMIQDPNYIRAVEKMFIKFQNVDLKKENNPQADIKKLLNEGKLDFNTLRSAVRKASQGDNQSPNDISLDLTTINVQNNHDNDLNLIRQYRIRQIEIVQENIMRDIMNDIAPKIILHNNKIWSNCIFSDRIQLDTSSSLMATVSFGAKNSRRKFCLILHLLSTIYQMLIKQSTCTRRELYYQNISWVKSQIHIDLAIRDICSCLNAPPWELGVLATSKGLIAGPLKITTKEGHVIQCMTQGGILIVHDVIGIRSVKSDAKFILVVEKDTIFQKLLDEGALQRLWPCIIMTGKGYPDINTRLMLKLLVDTLKIPSLALVDADPYGIEIMCTYRFGSLAMSQLSNKLAVPSLRWIGIHPSDIRELGATSVPLSENDINKCNDLLHRPYCFAGSDLSNQIRILLQENHKTDIEAICSMSQAYLTDRYIAHKICSENFI